MHFRRLHRLPWVLLDCPQVDPFCGGILEAPGTRSRCPPRQHSQLFIAAPLTRCQNILDGRVLERHVRIHPFQLRVLASSSESRFTSDTEAPPYLPHRLKNVALLTPCFAAGPPRVCRSRRPSGWRRSASRRTSTSASPLLTQKQSTVDC